MPRLMFLTGMLLMAASIPLSVFGMSLAQFIMIGAWLLERNYKTRFRLFYSNKGALLWCGFYGLHLLGSLWSSDTAYLVNDLRIKLPLLLLPFLMSSYPELIRQHYRLLFKVFVIATAISTLISTGVWLEIIPHENDITDIRQISVFISHIRLSLCVVFSFFLLLWFTKRHYQKKNFLFLTADSLLTIWFIVFIFILESLTGIIILITCLFLVLIIFTFRDGYFRTGIAGLILLFFMVVLSIVYLNRLYHQTFTPFDYSVINKEEKTTLGNDYQHCFGCHEMENSTPVYIFLCEPELRDEWNKLSKLPYDSLDKKGHDLKFTLIRYLASKGLRKDALGVHALSLDDIRAIENGIANFKYTQTGSFKMRIHKTMAEWKLYRKGGNLSGSTLVQRFEYWYAGYFIFKDHWIIGTGTGDVKKAFYEKYIELNSSLDEKWRLRAHNQYLTFALTFGIFGFLYFLLTFFYPVYTFQKRPAIFLIFITISALSFLNEDTLETQAGVTFAMFFMSLFLSVKADFHPLNDDDGRI